MISQIFKIQLSLNHRVKQRALIYNKDKSITMELFANQKIRDFMDDGKSLKKFVYGRDLNGKVEFDFSKEAPWQDW